MSRVKIFVSGKWIEVALHHEFNRVMFEGKSCPTTPDGGMLTRNNVGQINEYRLYNLDAKEYTGGNKYNV